MDADCGLVQSTVKTVKEKIGIDVVSRTDVKSWIKEGIEEALAPRRAGIDNAIALKPYLTRSDLQRLTGWSGRQIEYKKARREIPFIRRGRLILFPTQDILEWLEQGRVPSQPQREG